MNSVVLYRKLFELTSNEKSISDAIILFKGRKNYLH